MKNDVKWVEENRKRVTGLAKKRSALKGVVRFLAHRAAERTWMAAQRAEGNRQAKQGDSQ